MTLYIGQQHDHNYIANRTVFFGIRCSGVECHCSGSLEPESSCHDRD